MASKLIKLEDGTLVEVEVAEKKAKEISWGAADKITGATIDRIKPIILNACRLSRRSGKSSTRKCRSTRLKSNWA